MQYIIIRSDITRIQSRLFDILTIRIRDKHTTVTHMYYGHQQAKGYLKGLQYEKMYKVAFKVQCLKIVSSF